MPWDSTTRTVDNIKDPARKWQPLRTHDGRDSRYSPFEGELNLSFMFVLGCKRHCKRVSFEKIATKAGNPAPNIQYYPSALPPCNIRYCLQPTTLINIDILMFFSLESKLTIVEIF